MTILILTPIMLPVVDRFGISTVQFGVIMIMLPSLPCGCDEDLVPDPVGGDRRQFKPVTLLRLSGGGIFEPSNRESRPLRPSDAATDGGAAIDQPATSSSDEKSRSQSSDSSRAACM